jgi:anaerobic selenocysteine-containing dehydrogenase
MCACRCGLKVWLKPTVAFATMQGNAEHPVNKGVLCAKGSAGIMQHYSPARLRKPLLRVGKRGAGRVREIEWDEALALATAWLKPIRATQPGRTGVLHRPRPVAGAHRLVGAAIRHGELRRARRLLFGEHGRGRAVFDRWFSFWEFGEPDWEHTLC